MKKTRFALTIMLATIALLSVSACKGKSAVSSSTSDSAETYIQSEETANFTESVLPSESGQTEEVSISSGNEDEVSASNGNNSTEDPGPTQTAAPTQPSPTPTPVSPFENFSFDLSGEQTSVYARKLHIASGTNRTYFYGKDTLLSIQGSPLNRNAPFGLYAYQDETFNGEQYSIDGTSVAAIVDWEGLSTGKLVYCDGKSVINIADKVDSFCLSSDGSHLAYLTGKYEHGVGGTLYLYNTQTRESVFIASGAGRLFVLSPTGQSISYTQFYRKNDPDSLICYAKTGSEAASLVALDRYCIAISDDAKSIFCVKQNSSGYDLYVYLDLKEKLLSDSLNLEGDYSNNYYGYFGAAFCFNNDCTQIVYSDSTSTWFYVCNEEPVRVFDSGNAFLMGKSSMSDFNPNTLNAAFYQERIITDYARSVCSTSFSGTKNLCNVLFETDSEVGVFDEYLISYTIDYAKYSYASQDEWGSLLINSYKIPEVSINPHLDKTWALKADIYLGKTIDGRTFFVRDSMLYSLDTDGEEEKLIELYGRAVPYLTPYLDKIFILVSNDTDVYYEDYNPKDSEFFCSLYVIDTDTPTESCLISDLVDRNTFMINGSDITYAKFAQSLDEENRGWYFTVKVKEYFSSDGESFKYISTHPKTFEIMGG